MNTQRKKAVAAWLATLAWAGVIFYFSAQTDTVSSEQSGFFAGILESLFAPVQGGEGLFAFFDFIVRKGAHFAVYAVLGGLCTCAYAFSGVGRPWRRLGLAALTCALYAVTDEVHQYFVPGRAMMLADMLLDSVGAACGAACAIFFLKMRKV